MVQSGEREEIATKGGQADLMKGVTQFLPRRTDGLKTNKKRNREVTKGGTCLSTPCRNGGIGGNPSRGQENSTALRKSTKGSKKKGALLHLWRRSASLWEMAEVHGEEEPVPGETGEERRDKNGFRIRKRRILHADNCTATKKIK